MCFRTSRNTNAPSTPTSASPTNICSTPARFPTHPGTSLSSQNATNQIPSQKADPAAPFGGHHPVRPASIDCVRVAIYCFRSASSFSASRASRNVYRVAEKCAPASSNSPDKNAHIISPTEI